MKRNGSHCQWAPVRTVSYCTPCQRAGIRRFPLAENNLLHAVWLNTYFNMWNRDWSKWYLFYFRYRICMDKETYLKNLKLLSYIFVLSETIYQTLTKVHYILTTQNIVDFENQYPCPFEWDPSFTHWQWTANWNGIYLYCLSD